MSGLINRRGVSALGLLLVGLLWVAGCKGEEPFPLELSEEQTMTLGLDFKTLPDEGLVDQEGEAFSFEELFGDKKMPTIMTEIYTSCPEPDMCPMLMSKTARAQAILAEQGVEPDKYRVLVMSLDPVRDTPEAMARYGQAHGLEGENVHLVTGARDTIDEVMKKLEVGVRQAPDGTFMHSMRTYVLGPDGKITHGFRQAEWAPEHLATRLKSQL